MMVGYTVENIKSNERGMVHLDVLSKAVTEDVAGLMITNPNTVGVFEENIRKICGIMHDRGGSGLHGWREYERAGGYSAAG